MDFAYPNVKLPTDLSIYLPTICTTPAFSKKIHSDEWHAKSEAHGHVYM